MTKAFLVLSVLAGGLAVLLGAFAAHGLKARMDPALLTAFKTGVEYQFYHALALLGVALWLRLWPGESNQWLITGGLLFVFGLLFFSGSLYGLALLGWKWLGPITPLGGLCFAGGWICLFVAALRTP